MTGKALGLATLTALVVGNMVGSGVFMLPASLAPFGGASLIGWVVTAGGSMAIGLVLARLARRLPAAGGPYAYTREAFGEFTGFLVGWSYWISSWTAVAGIATAMVGYLANLVPEVAGSGAAAATTALIAITILTAVNVIGIGTAGIVQLVTTILKLLPLIAIALFGLMRFEPENLQPFNPTGEPLYLAAHGTLALTLWAFLGLEAGTIPAGEVRDARRTIPRATLLGVAIATVLYISSTTAVMGMVPRSSLAQSTAPFADAAAILWGPGAGKLIAAGGFISCFGAVNGWLLVSGQIPLALARDNLLPKFFLRTTARGTPTNGLVLAGALACVLVIANYTKSLVSLFTWIILLSTLASLIPLVFCTMAEVTLAVRARQRGDPEPIRASAVIAALAFVYGVLAVGSSGHEAAFWGLLTLLAGIPFYVVTRWRVPG